MVYNLYIFVRTRELGTSARNIINDHAPMDSQFRTEVIGHDPRDGKNIITGFWWRAALPSENLEACRAALDKAGTPWFREPEKLPEEHRP